MFDFNKWRKRRTTRAQQWNAQHGLITSQLTTFNQKHNLQIQTANNFPQSIFSIFNALSFYIQSQRTGFWHGLYFLFKNLFNPPNYTVEDNLITILNNSTKALATEYGNLDNDVEDLLAKIRELQDNRSISVDDETELGKLLIEKQEEVNALAKKNAALQQQIEKTKEEKESIEALYKAMPQQLQALRQEKNVEIKQLTDQKAVIENQLQELQIQNQQLNQLIKESKEQNEKQGDENKALKDSKEKLSKQMDETLQEKEKELGEQRRRAKTAEQELEKQKQQNEKQSQENKGLKLQIRDLSTKNEQLNSRLSTIAASLNPHIHYQQPLVTPLSTPMQTPKPFITPPDEQNHLLTTPMFTTSSQHTVYNAETSEGRNEIISKLVNQKLMPQIVFDTLDELVNFIHTKPKNDGKGNHQECVKCVMQWIFELLRFRIECNDVFISKPPKPENQTAEFESLFNSLNSKDDALKNAKINPLMLKNDDINKYCLALLNAFSDKQKDYLCVGKVALYFKQRGSYAYYIQKNELSVTTMQELDKLIDKHYSKQPTKDTADQIFKLLNKKDIKKHENLRDEICKDFKDGRFFPKNEKCVENFKKVTQTTSNLYQPKKEKKMKIVVKSLRNNESKIPGQSG